MRIPFLSRREDPPPASTMPVDGYQVHDRSFREVAGNTDLMQTQISDFWASLYGFGFSPNLIDKVWVANRCIQLNSQQISAMPLRFFGTYEPAWVSSPDPVWFPNGIGDAVFAAVRSMYAYGDAFLYVTDRYASGFPSAWTVLDPEPINVRNVEGKREYRSRNRLLNPNNVVQVSRNPGGGLRGTSALQAYGANMLSSIAAADTGRAIMNSGVPNAVLKSARKLTKDQAEALQSQWGTATSTRRGVPAVLPPDIDFEQLSLSPRDLMLLDGQQFDARVIAAAFGVPPMLINMPQESFTYQSAPPLFELWWRTELRPAAMRVSNALTANMLPRGSWVEFDARDVLAPDFKELVDAWKLIVTDMGAASIDEFRASVLRLPPQPEDESIQDQLVPPVAAKSGQTASADVLPLRPTQEVSG